MCERRQDKFTKWAGVQVIFSLYNKIEFILEMDYQYNMNEWIPVTMRLAVTEVMESSSDVMSWILSKNSVCLSTNTGFGEHFAVTAKYDICNFLKP